MAQKAEQVLGHFRAEFIAAVDANAIVQELKHQDIISNGDLNTILKISDETQQNEYLHGRLVRACDEDALRDVCKIIDDKGNRRSKTMSKNMLKMLESGGSASAPQPPQPGGAQPQPPQPEGAQPQPPQAGGAQPQPPQLGGAQTVQTSLDSLAANHPNYVMLFRTHVSRKAAGKARAVLEGVGLDVETIDACFTAHPLDDEKRVQAGLIKWVGGKGHQPSTWNVLIKAMVYAEIAQQNVMALKKELGH